MSSVNQSPTEEKGSTPVAEAARSVF